MVGDIKRAQLFLDLERLGPTQTKSLTVSEFMAEIEALRDFLVNSCNPCSSPTSRFPATIFFLSLALGIY